MNSDYPEIDYLIYRVLWYEKSKKTSAPGQQPPPTENHCFFALNI